MYITKVKLINILTVFSLEAYFKGATATSADLEIVAFKSKCWIDSTLFSLFKKSKCMLIEYVNMRVV